MFTMPIFFPLLKYWSNFHHIVIKIIITNSSFFFWKGFQSLQIVIYRNIKGPGYVYILDGLDEQNKKMAEQKDRLIIIKK